MAVAVKNTPETRTTPSPFDRMQIVALVGVVYLLGSLVIVFKVIPMIWAAFWGSVLNFQTDSFASYSLQGLLMLAGAAGLVVLGGKLLGPKTQPGVRAGIFTALFGLLLIFLLTRWYSIWAEHLAFRPEVVPVWGKAAIQGIGDFFFFLFATVLFLPAILGGWMGAMVMTIVVGLVLLFLFLRMFFSKRGERFLEALEEQGWFSGTNYKKNQGIKVRRGTILGILLLFGSGVWTLVSHNTLAGVNDLTVEFPFTGVATFTVDDLALPRIGIPMREELEKAHPDWFAAEAPAKNLETALAELETSLKKAKVKYPKLPQALLDDVRKARENVADYGSYRTGAREALTVVNTELKAALQELTDAKVDAALVKDLEAAGTRVKEAATTTLEVADRPIQMNRYVLQTLNQQIDPATKVMLDDPFSLPEGYKNYQVIPKTEYEKIEKDAIAKGNKVPDIRTPTQISGPETFASITLLPAVRYTLPLLLLGLTIWFAWRVVNLPVFADFLIATEGELNKVSWTTRRRLFQDTIVVMVTLVLMAFYLFAMDQIWGYVLSRKYIGVIVFPQDTTQQHKGTDKPW